MPQSTRAHPILGMHYIKVLKRDNFIGGHYNSHKKLKQDNHYTK